MRLFFMLWALCLIIFSCSEHEGESVSPSTDSLKKGSWVLYFHLNDSTQLPVNLEISEDGTANFLNGKERLVANMQFFSADSLKIQMPFFETSFLASIGEGGSRMSGLWFNYSKEDYSIPFHAVAGTNTRFCEGSDSYSLSDHYEVHFSPGTEDEYPAVGLFEHSDDNGTLGTFATETGDYRFLQGDVCDDTLRLSCFDGSHAFLFSARVKGDSLVSGQFYSGKHWNEPWVGWKHPDFTLRDPFTLTEVVDTLSLGKTRFILEDGTALTLDDLRSPGEVSIVQIMGSWCPNCMDESLYFRDLFQEYSHSGLSILPLSFESSDDVSQAYKAIHKLEQDLNLPFPIYYGGSRRKSTASAALPALNHVMSYPTSIFIDKKGKVRKVHTGFYGPSTGAYYDRYCEMTRQLVEQMLSES